MMTTQTVPVEQVGCLSSKGVTAPAGESDAPKWRTLRELRLSLGLREEIETTNPTEWSKRMLAQAGKEGPLSHLPAQLGNSNGRPKNAPIFDFIAERLNGHGFSWRVESVERKDKTQTVVKFTNYPTVRGQLPTLFDLAVLPLEAFDPPGLSVDRQRRFAHRQRWR